METKILDHEEKITAAFGFRDLDYIFLIPERMINVKNGLALFPSPD